MNASVQRIFANAGLGLSVRSHLIDCFERPPTQWKDTNAVNRRRDKINKQKK